MELDFQSLFGLHVHICTHWLRPRNIPPAFGLIYEGAIDQPRQTTSLCDPLYAAFMKDTAKPYERHCKSHGLAFNPVYCVPVWYICTVKANLHTLQSGVTPACTPCAHITLPFSKVYIGLQQPILGVWFQQFQVDQYSLSHKTLKSLLG